MKRQKEFVRGGAVYDRPILLDLCAGTQSVGKCIDLDEWQYVTLDINGKLGDPDLLCDRRDWESSGVFISRISPEKVGCIWLRQDCCDIA